MSEVLKDLTILRGDAVAYRGRAVVTNLVNTGLMLIVSAKLTDTWSTILHPRDNFLQILSDAEHFVVHAVATGRISFDYRVAVGELRSFLMDLNQWVEELEGACSEGVRERLNTYDGIVEFANPILERLASLNIHFEEAASQIKEEDLDVHKSFAQKELHPLIMSAPYPYRTFNKPLGYAGDYEMMNMIHRGVPEGQNLYAKLVNLSYTNLPIANSVKNRARLLEKYLQLGFERRVDRHEEFGVISIGCGPAIEVRRFIRRNESLERVRIDLVDFNQETLEHARTKVLEAIKESRNRPAVNFIHESVHSLLKSQAAAPECSQTSKYDFIYCAGLFDYLSDKVCARLLRLFYSWLKDDGVLLVTNMMEGIGNRYILEHQAEWYLIYRDESKMTDLVPWAGFKRTFTDDTGINVSLEIRKHGHGQQPNA